VMEPPSKQLIETLLGLKLCTRRDLTSCRRRVRRLARDLPAFDFVWIDSLLHARKLTPFQARLLEASEYDKLCVGPCVLIEQLGKGKQSSTYLARRRDGGQRLVLKAIELPAESIVSTRERLEQLVSSHNEFQYPNIVAPYAVIQHENQLVALSRYIPGIRLSELFIRRGRFPAGIVLEIGRQLVDGLAALEENDLVHGDIRSPNILLSSGGLAVLVDTGIGPVVSGVLSIHSDLPPHRYDGIAPELIGTGNHPSHVSDLYALGCLLWHLLAGRPPYPTNDPLAKLAAHQTREIADVREWAPDTPAPLAEAIKLFTQKDPLQRPQSFREVREKWGPPGRLGRRRLAGFRAMFNTAAPRIPVDVSSGSSRRWPLTVVLLLVLAGTTLFLLNKGARNQLLHWGKSSLGLLDQSPADSGTSSVKSHKDNLAENSSQQYRSLPEPNSDGLILLDSRSPYQADLRSFVGPMTIQGADESPAIILVTDVSLRLVAEQVTLENVHLLNAIPDKESQKRRKNSQMLLGVQSQNLTIRNCSFNTGPYGSTSPHSAILWRTVDPHDPTGEVVSLQNVVFFGAAGAIRFDTVPTGVRVSNCLKLGRGPMLAFASTPKAGRELKVALQQVTLRSSGSLLGMQVPDDPADSGRVTIEAIDCVFELKDSKTPLFLLASRSRSSRWLRLMKMTGEGSLVEGGLTVGEWQHPETGKRTFIESDRIQVAGISAGPFQFAGPNSPDPADSTVKSWRAPRRSPRPPGIEASLLKTPPNTLLLLGEGLPTPP